MPFMTCYSFRASSVHRSSLSETFETKFAICNIDAALLTLDVESYSMWKHIDTDGKSYTGMSCERRMWIGTLTE